MDPEKRYDSNCMLGMFVYFLRIQQKILPTFDTGLHLMEGFKKNETCTRLNLLNGFYRVKSCYRIAKLAVLVGRGSKSHWEI